MSAELLDRLLSGTLEDPDSAGTLSVATRRVEIGRALIDDAASLVASLGLDPPYAVVADPATWAAAGARVAASLAGIGEVVPIRFGVSPQPDTAAVAEVVARGGAASTLVAVGSGTINDVTKFAAFETGRPWCVFGTAASMNGYGSENAAITVRGHKRTLPARAAESVFLDLDVLAASPLRLTRAGLGDSICRSTAQADWLMAHLVLGTPYRTAPFRLLEADEERLVADPEGLVRGRPDALEVLARTLVLSGFGMAICGGSSPASQAEHLISHWLDMLGDPAWPSVLHGEHIAVTTLTVADLQHAILSGPAPQLGEEPQSEATLVARYGEALGRSCWAELARKRLDGDALRAVNAKLADSWTRITASCRAVARAPTELRDILARAGAPLTPDDLGIPAPAYDRAVRHAREIRDRFTVLDLAALSGRLEAA